MKFKVISFDIFQTLVDVNRRIPEIWKGILKDQYTDEKAAQGANAILSVLPNVYENSVHSEHFMTMEEVFQACAKKAVEILDFKVSPSAVAYNLMYQHAKAPFYPEVLDCICKIHNKYKIVLSSDSNHLMVDDLIEKINYDMAFLSDDLKCYKGSKNGDFFKSVLNRLNITPEEVLHIGDSAADVWGSHNAGIISCWINRNGCRWNTAEVKPDMTIHSFNDLESII